MKKEKKIDKNSIHYWKIAEDPNSIEAKASAYKYMYRSQIKRLAFACLFLILVIIGEIAIFLMSR